VAACYLARAGLSVIVLERRDVVGGACVTEEPFPGFKLSTAAYSIGLLHPRIIADLRLREFGLDFYVKNPGLFLPLPDGRYLILWRDMAAAQREIAKFSQADADAFPRFESFWDRAVDLFFPLLLEPPPDPDQLAARFRGEDAEIYRAVMFSSVADLLDRYFESEVIKGAFATQGVIGTLAGPRTPGTAYVMAHHYFGELHGERRVWGYVRGGMGAITQALAGWPARTTVRGTRVELSGGFGRPPMAKTPATALLVEWAQNVAQELGFEINDAATGGASDANDIAALGVPVLDGLGPIGGLDHSPDEYIEADSIVPRTALLAELIQRTLSQRDRLAKLRQRI